MSMKKQTFDMYYYGMIIMIFYLIGDQDKTLRSSWNLLQ